MSNTSESDVKHILNFVENNDVQFLSSHLELKKSALGGIGVFATQDIEAEHILLRVPKSSIFTAENSTIANALVDAEIDGMLALNIAFIYEVSVFKEKSHWFEYLRTIKWVDNEGQLYLPPSYYEDAKRKQYLRGTTLDTMYNGLSPQSEVENGFSIACDLAVKISSEYHLEIPKIFATENLDDKQIWRNLLEFVSVGYSISSRCFEIDRYHQYGLVIIADLFNHHVTSPDVHFESVFDVCDKCGEVGECGHIIAEEKLTAIEELQKKPEKIGTFDHKQLDNFTRQLENNQELSDDELLENPNETFIEDRVIQGIIPDECVDIRLVNNVKKGEEIFNSYGELSNSLLLARYGFVVENNPCDVVNMADAVIQYSRKASADLKARIDWWKDMGHEFYFVWYESKRSEEEEEDEEEDEEEPENGDSRDGKNSQDAPYDGENIQDDGQKEDFDKPSKWLDEMFIDNQGKLTPLMLAFVKLLSFNKFEWEKFYTEDPNELWDRVKCLELNSSALLSNKKTRKILEDIVAFKAKWIIPKDADSNIKILLSSENFILDQVRSK
ncbi:protein-lysine N-methyltransferase SCDLUD_003634 [Saccharomycodes ludwigii]|uniref:protein-lysine N-methyltransferase n=1 Tax=Saccharomycodes ludwigii TaxID=36035 RepID=UPI001E85AF49|nr:hypothetical protein SCDLUD_003634 [Saccharomycodes ludwigii]KAH3900639.1 hypothetical protein SCDLUD_003634 [Saccharomycodes ludwigii]